MAASCDMGSDKKTGRLLVVAGLLACCASVSAAQPAVPNPVAVQCVRGEPEPQLAGSTQLRSHVFTKTGPLKSVENAVLRDGLAVTINQYGCAHFGLEVVFDAAERHRDESVLQAARRLMQRLLRMAPDFSIGQRFLDVSAQGAQATVPIEFVETEGYSWFVVTADSRGSLVVAYDVAL